MKKNCLHTSLYSLLLLMFVSVSSTAQNCNNYVLANQLNTILIRNDKQGFSAVYLMPSFVDIDNDGDLDCYVTDYNFTFDVRFFENIGTNTIPEYVQNSKAGGFTEHIYNGNGYVKFADFDGDGDMDIFITPYNLFGTQTIRYYENVGTKFKPKFIENDAKNPLSFITGELWLRFSIADIDGDGDYDVFTSDVYHNYLYQNIGTKTNPKFQLIDSGNLAYNERLYYDWNRDGLLDYFDFNGYAYYRNVSKTPGDLKYIRDSSGPSFNGYILQSLADINGDGIPEAFSEESDMLTVTTTPQIIFKDIQNNKLLIASPADKNYSYQWQYNGEAIAGANKANIKISKRGAYSVSITNSCGTGTSLPYVYLPNAVANNSFNLSHQNKLINSIKIYPNPSVEQFNVYLNGNESENTFIKIYDLQGKILSVTKANESVIKLGNNLQTGSFLVQVIKSNDIIFTQKIIKQ